MHFLRPEVNWDHSFGRITTARIAATEPLYRFAAFWGEIFRRGLPIGIYMPFLTTESNRIDYLCLYITDTIVLCAGNKLHNQPNNKELQSKSCSYFDTESKYERDKS